MALSNTVTERWISGPKRWSRGTLLTNNTTYAAGGLAMPSNASFGFVRQMDSFVVMGQDTGPATQYLTEWDKANSRLQFYVSHDTAGVTALPLDEEGTDALGTRTYQYIASGW